MLPHFPCLQSVFFVWQICMQKNKADYSTRQTGVLNLIWPYIHTFVQRIVDSGTGVVISDRMTNIHKLAFTNRKLGKKKLLAKDYICPAL